MNSRETSDRRFEKRNRGGYPTNVKEWRIWIQGTIGSTYIKIQRDARNKKYRTANTLKNYDGRNITDIKEKLLQWTNCIQNIFKEKTSQQIQRKTLNKQFYDKKWYALKTQMTAWRLDQMRCLSNCKSYLMMTMWWMWGLNFLTWYIRLSQFPNRGYNGPLWRFIQSAQSTEQWF